MIAETQTLNLPNNFPPMMPWRQFANWIQQSPDVVRGWVDNGHLPTIVVGRRRMVNLVQLVEQLSGEQQ